MQHRRLPSAMLAGNQRAGGTRIMEAAEVSAVIVYGMWLASKRTEQPTQLTAEICGPSVGLVEVLTVAQI